MNNKQTILSSDKPECFGQKTVKYETVNVNGSLEKQQYILYISWNTFFPKIINNITSINFISLSEQKL